MQESHTTPQAETRFASITRVEEKRLPNALGESLVRVAKDNHIRPVLSQLCLQPLSDRVWINNVVQEKFPVCQTHRLRQRVLEARVICVAADRSNWRDLLEFEQDSGPADVAAMQDVIDTLK